MASRQLHGWLQNVGLAAFVGSLILAGQQVTPSDEIACSEVSESTAIRGIEQRALTAAHADIWQKAWLGDELSASEKVIDRSASIAKRLAAVCSWLSAPAKTST